MSANVEEMVSAGRLEPTVADDALVWPREPYKGLATYRASDRLLFSGREDDVRKCVSRLVTPSTRILLVHGHTGCGKSSFLRAGLVPAMEGLGTGHLFLRDANRQPLFIRSGRDPLARLAESIWDFANHPIDQPGARAAITADPSKGWSLGASTVEEYVSRCRVPGQFCESLATLMMTEGLFSTLYLILDQVEEVITLASPDEDTDFQFFRFVREFSSFPFPLKLVFALRKDYSGQVIEMAQVAGALDLQDSGPVTETNTVPEHRTDAKLYLLREFDRERVLGAIELPTTRISPAAGVAPPFQTYQFEYEAGLAERITTDLFRVSSTAVLPAMQIVCRDLFEAARNTTATAPTSVDAATVSRITTKLYESRGEIAGPVDRHISNSLRASFDNHLDESMRMEEELRWRTVLHLLVHRESSGSVYTAQVAIDQLRKSATAHKCVTSFEQVIAHLERPDVLLLRRVQSTQAEDPSGKLCLGHDFLAMVLDRWHVTRVAEEGARQEASARDAKRRRRVRVTVAISALSVVGALALAFTVLISAHVGKLSSNVQVMADAASMLKDDEPMLAMLIAARAVKESETLLSFLPGHKERRQQFVRLLQELVSRAPAWRSDPDQLIGEGQEGAALPLTKGFLSVGKDKATLYSTTSQPIVFALHSLNVDGRLINRGERVDTRVAEISPGLIVLLRMRFWLSSLVDFQLEVLDATASSSPSRVQLYSATDIASKWPTNEDIWTTQRSVVLGRETLAITTSRRADDSKHLIAVHSDVYSLAELRSGSKPKFLRSIKLPTISDPTISDSMRFGFATLRDGIAFQLNSDSGSFNASFMRWTGETSPLTKSMKWLAASNQPPKASDSISTCPSGGCTWVLSSLATDGSALVLGTRQDVSSDAGGAPLQISSYDYLLLVDSVGGKSVVAATRNLPHCDRASQGDQASRRWSISVSDPGARVGDFVALDGNQGFIVGVARGSRAMDILRLDSLGNAECVRSISFDEALTSWTMSADRSMLLASGPRMHAQWNLSSQAAFLMTADGGKALAAACDILGKDAERRYADDQWKAATHLDPIGTKLCK